MKALALYIAITSLALLNACSKPEHSTLDRSAISTELTPPNIIFYLADDQNITDYGVYGNEKVHTPAVDKLAKQGMLFNKAFTAQAICAPSRSQLFTGLYPLKNGAFANHTPVKPNLITVTKRMRALGYEVVLAGKSHVKPSNVFDWDHEWQPVPKEGVPRDYIPLADIVNYFQTATKPFVMFIASKYPHGKYFDVENPNSDDLKFYPFDQHLADDPAYIKKRAGYYRSIAEDNTQLEQVLAYVDKHLTDNTLFIYSADHGVSGKFSVKDIGLNVPFVARWPKVIAPNSVSNQLIHYTDVLPTFIDIATAYSDKKVKDEHKQATMDGRSFLSLFNGKDKPIHQYVYGVRTNQNIINARVFPSRMIRDTRYKYIRNFNALEVLDKNLSGKENVDAFLLQGAQRHNNEVFEELYDLNNDPFEQQNLLTKDDVSPELLEVKQRLQQQMFVWMAEQGDILSDDFGNIPIISAPMFKLDQNKAPWRFSVPEALQNTLTPADYLVIEHW